VGNLGQIVEFVKHSLAGFDASKDSVAALASPITSTSLTVPIDDTDVQRGASRGIAEIDMEIVRVSGVDRDAGALVLYPFGRGYRGTTAAAHSAGVEVRLNPEWPASTVAREVNGVLTEIYPRLYAVSTHETVVPSDLGAIDVPEEAVGIIAVYIEDRLRDDQWVRLDTWRFQRDSSDIGRPLRIGGHQTIGDAVRVVYAHRPGLFNLEGGLSQDFETVTGLNPGVEDLIRLGVATRMAPFIDVARLPFVVTEAKADAGARPATGGASAARLLYSMFQARLEQEVAALHRDHPIRLHFTGR